MYILSNLIINICQCKVKDIMGVGNVQDELQKI